MHNHWNDQISAIQIRSLKFQVSRAVCARRRSIARRYSDRIRHAAIAVPDASGDDYVAHLYVVRTPARASLQAHLAHRGIATDVHYPIPDHRQGAYAADRQPALPVTERLAGEVLTLPCFPELSDDESDRVIEACNDWRPGN